MPSTRTQRLDSLISASLRLFYCDSRRVSTLSLSKSLTCASQPRAAASRSIQSSCLAAMKFVGAIDQVCLVFDIH